LSSFSVQLLYRDRATGDLEWKLKLLLTADLICSTYNAMCYHLSDCRTVGLSQLEQLMTDPEFKVQGGVLDLLYPERFLNVIEQRLLLERAESAGFDAVNIETHSVYIIQTVNNGNAFIKSVQGELTQETSGPFKKSMS